jgi:hypothetical protein
VVIGSAAPTALGPPTSFGRLAFHNFMVPMLMGKILATA